jgi:hypothetical protein
MAKMADCPRLAIFESIGATFEADAATTDRTPISGSHGGSATRTHPPLARSDYSVLDRAGILASCALMRTMCAHAPIGLATRDRAGHRPSHD